MTTRVVVTGASGFLGRRVVTAMVADHDVVAVTGRRRLPHDLATRCTAVVAGDLTDDHFAKRVVDGADVVCHLAARIPVDHEDPAEAEACVRANALATDVLARAASVADAGRFVYTSSGNLYGPSDAAVGEQDPTYPSARATYYLASKLLGELYLEHLRLASRIESVTLRASSIYGPGMSENSVVSRFVSRAIAGDVLEVQHGGTTTADHVYVDDVVSCVVSATRSGAGVYNVGSGRATSLGELARAVVEAYDSQSAVDVVEPEGQAPASFPALRLDRAREAWGYEPLDILEGLRRLRSEGA